MTPLQQQLQTARIVESGASKRVCEARIVVFLKEPVVQESLTSHTPQNSANSKLCANREHTPLPPCTATKVGLMSPPASPAPCDARRDEHVVDVVTNA
ncbi:hypothetical protein HPB48_010195 [Haemaphysalis longicornis]|uniref:Uncharacterized protein n=1 Tax=Haemaphysalis longicornis TaxID=44386 RepID=A0A9J6GN41_HAELO|nr:hypothetical protein HPB48_010195 [Haemaphysalis longicornis]